MKKKTLYLKTRFGPKSAFGGRTKRTSEEILKRGYWKSNKLAMRCEALRWIYELKLVKLSKFSINMISVKSYGILSNKTADIIVYSNSTLYKHDVYYFPTDRLCYGPGWIDLKFRNYIIDGSTTIVMWKLRLCSFSRLWNNNTFS